MPGILLIHGGDDHARSRFRSEQRADWSQALPLVLEKHGLLDLEVGPPETLESPSALEAADAVLVARLPPAAWTEAAVRAVTADPVRAIVEGPLPPELDAHLGVTAAEALDRPGSIMPVDAGLRAAGVRYGATIGGSLTPPTITAPVQRPDDLDWRAIDAVPISSETAEAWEAPAWDVVRWDASGGEVLCDWVAREGPKGRHPAVVRRGSLVGCSFGLFGFLGQRHSVEPFGVREWRATDRTLGLEVLLLALIDAAYAAAGSVRPRVLPWPEGVRYARSVRHEVTAGLDAGTVSSLRNSHRDAKTRATLYCAPSAADRVRPAIDGLLDDGHEVALLAERLWGAPAGEERRAVESGLGVTVRGTASRGSSHCFRHQGAPNLLWAEREGLEYTENVGRSHLHPHRTAALREDGTLHVLQVICLPHAESLEGLLKRKGDLADREGSWAAAGGLWQLTVPPAADGLSRLSGPREDRADLTAGEAIAWWRATHVLDNLRVRSLSGRRFRVTAAHAVEGAQVELLHPDGTLSRYDLTVAAGDEATIDGSSTADESVDPSAELERAILALGRIDREGLSARARLAGQAAEALPQAPGTPPRLVVDLAPGDAAAAGFLALRLPEAEIVAAERTPDAAQAARRVLRAAGLSPRVTVLLEHDGVLRAVGTGEADAVLLPSPEDRQRLREAARVLRPEGRLFVSGPSDQIERVLRRTGFRVDAAAAGLTTAVPAKPGRSDRRSPLPRPRPVAPARALPSWSNVERAYEGRLKIYFEERGKEPGDAATLSTIRTNTSLVPSRSELLLRGLDELVGVPSLTGLRVLEVGCGYGALAHHLALSGPVERLVATDIDRATLGVSQEAAAALEMTPMLTFVEADMRDLSEVPGPPFDVVLINNAFIYLTSTRDMQAAIEQFRHVIVEGGAILFYHANRWRWTEPFSGDPLVHLLPPALARPVARAKGWRHNHGRVKLISPGQLSRLLRRGGFEPLGVRAYGGHSDWPGKLGESLGTFYALGARARGG